MLGEVPEGKLVGLVSVLGSGNSHVAILARAMGIPTVMGLVDLPYSKVDGIDMIVDGHRGEVFTNPSEVLRKQYAEVVEEEKQLALGLDSLRELPCVTLDGHRVPLAGQHRACWPMWPARNSAAPKAWGCTAPKCRS